MIIILRMYYLFYVYYDHLGKYKKYIHKITNVIVSSRIIILITKLIIEKYYVSLVI